MIRTLLIAGKPYMLRLSAEREGYVFELSLNGETPSSGNASVIEVEPDVFSVLISGRSYEVRVNGTANVVEVDGDKLEVKVEDPRSQRAGAIGKSADGGQTLKAVMPGKVVRVLVAEGDEVAAGDGIAVVEAMKMQNELKAQKPGRVVSLSAREGAAVAAGEVLAVIE